MDSDEMTGVETIKPAAEAPPARSGRVWKVALGVVLVSCFGLAALAAGVYFAFDTIRNGVRAASVEIPLITNEPARNQIAFIGNDFNLWVVEPSGQNRHRLTTDGNGYRFPTWSPDGSNLAFLGRGAQSRSVLYVAPTSGGSPSVVYNNADAPPFYLYWSPDSSAISFLAQEADKMSMRVVEPYNPASQRVVAEGAPFYWVWSPNSQKMLLHVGGSRAASADAHVSLLDNKTGASRVELNLTPGRFQAPVWTRDGAAFYTVAADENADDAIFKTDAESLAQQKIAKLDGFAHMVLSPTGRHIAYLQLERGISPPFGSAYLIDSDGQNKKPLIKSPVASIYWSPDGTKLALLSLSRPQDGPTAKIDGLAAPLQQAINLRWWVYNVETEELAPVFSFSPTTAFLQTVPYFDQYHLSLSFWSPDSRYLVATRAEDEQNILGSVYVIDTTGDAEPLKVGDGSLAVWSWQ